MQLIIHDIIQLKPWVSADNDHTTTTKPILCYSLWDVRAPRVYLCHKVYCYIGYLSETHLQNKLHEISFASYKTHLKVCAVYFADTNTLAIEKCVTNYLDFARYEFKIDYILQVA